MSMKDAYTGEELALLLGYKNARNVRDRAKREGWQSRPRVGRGGGKEWLVSSMPETTRIALQTAIQRQLFEDARENESRVPELVKGHLPALRDVTPGLPCISTSASITNAAILDDRRRYQALAKADLVRLYLEWQRKHGATVYQKETFIHAYLGGAWPKLLTEFGERVSWKSLERWKNSQSRAGSVLALADKRGLAHRGRSLITEKHQQIILGLLLNPNAPLIGQCVRRIQARCTEMEIDVPSEATIRRWAKVFMQECYNAWVLWREGKKAWNDKCALSVLREWTLIEVGDVVIADGHTLNFETINPQPC